MTRRSIHPALLSLGVFLLTCALAYAHDQAKPEPAHEAPQPAAKATATDLNEASLKDDPAAAFAILVESVMGTRETVELTELSQYPDLFQLVAAAPGGRYWVKQLVLTKGDEVRALSVGVHPPHDLLLARGREVGPNTFEGIYYVIDRAGWLKGAAFRQGAVITEILRGDAWQGYEREKSFWIWQAEQIAASRRSGR